MKQPRSIAQKLLLTGSLSLLALMPAALAMEPTQMEAQVAVASQKHWAQPEVLGSQADLGLPSLAEASDATSVGLARQFIYSLVEPLVEAGASVMSAAADERQAVAGKGALAYTAGVAKRVGEVLASNPIDSVIYSGAIAMGWTDVASAVPIVPAVVGALSAVKNSAYVLEAANNMPSRNFVDKAFKAGVYGLAAYSVASLPAAAANSGNYCGFGGAGSESCSDSYDQSEIKSALDESIVDGVRTTYTICQANLTTCYKYFSTQYQQALQNFTNTTCNHVFNSTTCPDTVVACKGNLTLAIQELAKDYGKCVAKNYTDALNQASSQASTVLGTFFVPSFKTDFSDCTAEATSKYVESLCTVDAVLQQESGKVCKEVIFDVGPSSKRSTQQAPVAPVLHFPEIEAVEICKDTPVLICSSTNFLSTVSHPEVYGYSYDRSPLSDSAAGDAASIREIVEVRTTALKAIEDCVEAYNKCTK